MNSVAHSFTLVLLYKKCFSTKCVSFPY
ncbi:hypothetical protein KM915_18550 [Cytobacillus oceanisediminis]|nr:hypothetical protein [Cytobacillus oceanisediminis]QOK29607.1 hypothetical protein IIE26_01745 [Cytobacillus oceanisediminis]